MPSDPKPILLRRMRGYHAANRASLAALESENADARRSGMAYEAREARYGARIREITSWAVREQKIVQQAAQSPRTDVVLSLYEEAVWGNIDLEEALAGYPQGDTELSPVKV